MGLIGNIVSDQMEKRQNVTSQAIQLQNYCTEHEQELKSGTEGGRFVMLNSTDVWGEFIMHSDQKAIAKRLGMDSDGWFTIMANHTELIMHYEETAGIVVRGYKGSGSTSSSMSSGSWDNNDEEEEARLERKRQARERRNQNKLEEESKARDIVKEIEAMPITQENIIPAIKESAHKATLNTFSSKTANELVKDAWQERLKSLRAFADIHCAEDEEYNNFLEEERAQKAEEEKALAEKKAREAAEKEAKKREEKERRAAEELKEAHEKKVNRISWLTWLGLSIFFLCMGDAFDYDWYHYVLIVLASIISAAVLLFRWMFL